MDFNRSGSIVHSREDGGHGGRVTYHLHEVIIQWNEGMPGIEMQVSDVVRNDGIGKKELNEPILSP